MTSKLAGKVAVVTQKGAAVESGQILTSSGVSHLEGFRPMTIAAAARGGSHVANRTLDVLVLGSGFGGKLLAWHMKRSGRPTAVVRRWRIEGSSRYIACLRQAHVGPGAPGLGS